MIVLRSKEAAELDALREEMIEEDVREVLSTPAGRRLVGSIFVASRRDEDPFIAGSADVTAYYAGMQRVGAMLANTIRAVDPRLVAECEIAHEEFEKMFETDNDGEEE